MRSSIRRFAEKRNRLHFSVPINSNLSNDEMDMVIAISKRLNTGLNDRALSAIVDLLLEGVPPDAIVATITSLDQYATKMEHQQGGNTE